MKLELDLNSSQKTTLINHSENDLGAADVKTMLRSGISFAKEGNRVEARQMLLGVTEVEPNNETAWLWLASISEYPEELLVFLQNVLKVNPHNERALEWAKQTKSLLSKTFVQRGINAAQNNQKEFAKQCFLQGIVHDGENEMAWLWLASSSESQEEKVSHLQQVLRINPSNETALSSLNAVRGQQSQGLLKKANSAAIAGDHETARQTLNAVLKNSPDLEEAWILKAFLATDFYQKIECYQKALEINPECEAAQAGLDSLKLLMPKAAKPAVEEVKAEEVTVVEELKAEEVTVAEETVKAEEASEVHNSVEAFLEKAAEDTIPEAVEFDQNFDLEQLAAESPVENVELAAQENAVSANESQSENSLSNEEISCEIVSEEESIHETQTGFKEDFSPAASQSTRVESIFNYNEVIAQEESQAESVLEFEETSNNPTQELDEDFAKNAAAEFGVAETEELLLNNENAAELEDFYSEQAAEETAQEVAQEETAAVSLKTEEVRVTETYVAQINPADVYGSEFYANDGFVLAPQNDPFADYQKETVEFSYSEEKVDSEEFEAQTAEAAEQIAETAEPVEAANYAEEVEQLTEISPALEETSENQPAGQFEAAAETLAAEEFVENQSAAQDEEAGEIQAAEEVQNVFETQAAEEIEEIEQTAAAVETEEEFVAQDTAAQFVAVEYSSEAQSFAEEDSSKTQAAADLTEISKDGQEVREEMVNQAAEEPAEFAEAEQVQENVEFAAEEQYAEAEYHGEVLENQTAEQNEETNEFQSAGQEEKDPSSATRSFPKYNQEIFRLERGEEIQPTAVADQFEKIEQVGGEAGSNEEYAQLVSEMETLGSQAALSQCPFCAAENESQAVVCSCCQAMLSLANLETLISHQGVNQNLLLQAIEKMEVEKSLRDFNAEELTFLAIANLNAKNLEKGLGYLKEASELNPNDIVLHSKIKFLTAHLDELKENRFRNAENPAGNRTILVVDDSPTVRKLISGKLEKCGHSVLSAVDGMDALAKINEVIPDLILLDITMPRLDGYQVCKLIRNNEMTKDVPIIMISGKDGFFDKVRGRMAGSTGYITKPFGPDTLMKTIETYFG